MSGSEREAAVVAFLSGRGPDGAGRTVGTVLAFSDDALERHHDYIQWLFPLTEASRAVPGSPVLSPGGVDAIRNDAEALRSIDQALAAMTGFYTRRTHWLVPQDHNHLRITRIIRSVAMLRGIEPARAFLSMMLRRVEAAGSPVSPRSLGFWREAAGLSGSAEEAGSGSS